MHDEVEGQPQAPTPQADSAPPAPEAVSAAPAAPQDDSTSPSPAPADIPADSAVLPASTRQTRALAPLPPLDLAPHDEMTTATRAMPLIIQGSGTFVPPRLRLPRRQRPLINHFAIVSVVVCLVVTTLVATAVVRDPSLVTMPGQAFSALASSFKAPAPGTFTLYQVRSGDTIEAVAQRFDVAIGGIYELNHFYLSSEITVGQVIKIPSDSTYGVNFRPTAPPIAQAPPPSGGTAGKSGGGSAPKGTIYGGCQFCSIAGYSTGGPCAPQSTTNVGFGLINPNPGAHWVRGFTWYHNGVDISTGRFGTPIIAAQDGQVIFSGWDPYGGGYAIKINHCWGLSTSYCHMEKLLVRLGQFVHKGDIIGLQGSTGNSTGTHLHFMVWWNNQFLDPVLYLPSLTSLPRGS